MKRIYQLVKKINIIVSKWKNILHFGSYIGFAYNSLKYLFLHGPRKTYSKIRYYRLKQLNNSSHKLPTLDAGLRSALKITYNYKFSIIIVLYGSPSINILKEMLNYIQAQSYNNWELFIADICNELTTESQEYLKNLIHIEPRIRYSELPKKSGIVHAVSIAYKLSTGNYIVIMRQGDILDPHALSEMALVIDQNPLADVIYADWAEFSGDTQEIVKFNLVPGFSPDYLRSVNYVGHMTAYSRDIIDQVGFMREGYDGNEFYELFLRATETARHVVHIPKMLYWSRSSDIGAVEEKVDSVVAESGSKAISDHLSRISNPGQVDHIKDLNAYRIRYTLKQAKISIIIPNKDHIRELRQCISSILNLSTYGEYEIIVAENNSNDSKTIAYYESIRRNPRIKILETGIRGFNYSAVNNCAARQASGEYLLLLNNDTKVISPRWIEEMLMFAQRRDVGTVGALLLYRNYTVQHCGLVVGYDGNIAGNPGYGIPFQREGGPAFLRLPRNYSAMTAACMMVKKSDYFTVGGFNEEDFPIGLNDVDFCLKLREAGLINVWTPYARLYHYESVSRGSDASGERKARFDRECARLKEKWSRYFNEGDPYRF